MPKVMKEENRASLLSIHTTWSQDYMLLRYFFLIWYEKNVCFVLCIVQRVSLLLINASSQYYDGE